jgi:hypothetical protein
MASTGMRVGALPGLKLKHLKKWDVQNASSYHFYQITVYANSPNDQYTTFCTPEAAKAIDDYLEFRKRYGDNLDGNSYLFIKNFNKMQSFSSVAGTNLIHKRPITAGAIHAYVVDRLVESGLRTVHSFSAVYTNNNRFSHASSYKNELHPCHSLSIFAVTNMQRSKVDKTIREVLVGYSTGLDKSYYKPQDEEILHEYLKAVDSLTIDNENRLKKLVKELKDPNYKPTEKEDIVNEFSKGETTKLSFTLLKDKILKFEKVNDKKKFLKIFDMS